MASNEVMFLLSVSSNMEGDTGVRYLFNSRMAAETYLARNIDSLGSEIDEVMEWDAAEWTIGENAGANCVRLVRNGTRSEYYAFINTVPVLG